VWTGRGQGFRSVAGMVGVITAVLAGSVAALVAIVASDHSPAAALIAGAVIALAAVSALMRHGRRKWIQAVTAPLTEDGNKDAPAGADLIRPS
jgi:hypothetical protein